MRTVKAGEDLIKSRKPESIRVVDDVEVVRRSASSSENTGTPRFWPRTLKGEDMRRGRSALDCALKMGTCN